MTWPQVERFAEAAMQRRMTETYKQAQLMAMAVNVGMSGDQKPLRRLAQELGMKGNAQPPREAASAVQRMADQLHLQGLLRKNHGPHGR